MSNLEKLEELMMNILLLEPGEFSFDLMRDDVETWDSLAVVSVAVGVNETFGYHFTPKEAMEVKGVQDIITLLESKGIPFNEQKA